MVVPAWLWIVTLVALVGIIVIDLVLGNRRKSEFTTANAVRSVVTYVSLAALFAVFVSIYFGGAYGGQFVTGYILEYSLSVDNLFVFIIILTQFAVPNELHQRVLLFGVVLALILRAAFIAVGAAALAAFSFTFVIFGAILIWTGIQLARHRNEDPDQKDNAVVRLVRRRIPLTDEFHGTKAFVRVDGRRMATPLLLVMVAIGTTDLLFALDSIPAIFGVTQEPYLVFTANAFALLGLRALYFLLKGMLDKIVYLSTGLAVILVFIGIKLVLTYLNELNPSIPHVSTYQSLGFILLVLLVVLVASWLKIRRDPTARGHSGRITRADDERRH